MSNADLIERATWLENGDDGAFSRIIRELVAALESAEARAVEAERALMVSVRGEYVAALQRKLAAAREALETADADIRHHLRSDEIHAALIRPHAIQAIRAALSNLPALAPIAYPERDDGMNEWYERHRKGPSDE